MRRIAVIGNGGDGWLPSKHRSAVRHEDERPGYGPLEVSLVQYLLMFYADEREWLALSEAERSDAIGRIGRWFGQHAGAGTIVDGKRLRGGRAATTTVRLGRIQRSGDRPIVTDGPFVEAKESVGSYAIVEAKDRAAAIAIASSWPAGGLVEVRPLEE